jgi:hypothetical protein
MYHMYHPIYLNDTDNHAYVIWLLGFLDIPETYIQIPWDFMGSYGDMMGDIANNNN